MGQFPKKPVSVNNNIDKSSYWFSIFAKLTGKYGLLFIAGPSMQILKTNEIELLRHNGAEFQDITIVPVIEEGSGIRFSIEFTVKGRQGDEERALLMTARNKPRTFADVRLALPALYQIFPELHDIGEIRMTLENLAPPKK